MIDLTKAATCIALLGAYSAWSQVLDGTFTDLDPLWVSGQSVDKSLVSTPILDFVNDTAASLVWKLRTDDPVARMATNFELEVSFEHYSDDFQYLTNIPVNLPEDYSNSSYTELYTVSGLLPLSNYRFRVCPTFASGRGYCSLPLMVTTLANAVNYWEPILTRRLSLVASGRGFTNPVMQRPHLDTGVEIHKEDTSDNPLRFSDAVTSETPVLPSGRRGHSLSLVDQTVYMFGGRTNGYSCATVYKDTMDLGNTESGREVYPCVHFQSEVSELWSFDVSTYQWVFLNTSKWQVQTPPPAREQHSSAVVDRDIYVFGGKTRIFAKNADQERVFEHHGDTVYGDLWKLSVERAHQYVLHYPNSTNEMSTTNTSIPQDGRLFAVIDARSDPSVAQHSDGVSNREGLCVDKIIVRVTLTHPCLSQVKVSLTGPGPQSGSPNFFPQSSDQEVVLFSSLQTNGTGCASGVHSFTFDDDSTRRPDACCGPYSGVYQPQGRLSEFIGTTMTADWTLIAQDLKGDQIAGELVSWEIEFTSSPCVKNYLWQNLTTAHAVSPPARYGAHILSHESSLFVYGGRDVNDQALHDLYRYDTLAAAWTSLVPVNFDIALYPSSSVGANFALTSWGLIRFGGHYRQPNIPEEYSNYDASVAVQDPVTLRWQELSTARPAESPLRRDATFGRRTPSSRYLGASVFIPSHSLHWRSKYTHHNLYDHVVPSARTNYEGSIADSVFLFGGFDGSTGSVLDGSAGGFLRDTWMLRLANYSTPGARDRQQRYIERHCQWRSNPSAVTSGTHSCLYGGHGAECEWRDLLLLPWCAGNNQTFA